MFRLESREQIMVALADIPRLERGLMTVRIIQGDVREKLAELPADYFDCIVTSPPYYGLRDYGTATWEGGDHGCDHSHFLGGNGATSQKQITSLGTQKYQFRDVCAKCGARRIDAQIGIEPTLDAYLETMVAVCRELRRVLKPSGVFFLNIGDSYSAGASGKTDDPFKKCSLSGGRLNSLIARKSSQSRPLRSLESTGIKPKDLCLVPERLGIMLQAEGWWVRSKIIWHKLNPMPESCTDRPTSAHETIWLLAKSATYFWDAEAVKEESVGGEGRSTFLGGTARLVQANVCSGGLQPSDRGIPRPRIENRSLRNVWSFASQPFTQGHFATFPPELAERCIKAGSSERGCCVACGKPWVRVVYVSYTDAHKGMVGNQRKAITDDKVMHAGREEDKRLNKHVQTLGWYPTCKCAGLQPLPAYPRKPLEESEVEAWHKACAAIRAERKLLCDAAVLIRTSPAQMLDPFAGAGTTGLAADRLGRDCTLIDLNVSYATMALNRIRDDAPLFAEVAAE